MQTQLKTAQAGTLANFLIELVKPTQDKIVLKNFQRFKKNSTHSRHSMIQKLNTDNGLQGCWIKTTSYKTGLVNITMNSSFYTFFVVLN